MIASCAEPSPGREDTWIEPELEEAYIRMHEAGYAHSVECWDNDVLVGGAYGVSLGGFFAGESMFSRISDGSKMALAHLIEHLRKQGFILLDTQMVTPHTQSLGAFPIPRELYLQKLKAALEKPCRFF